MSIDVKVSKEQIVNKHGNETYSGSMLVNGRKYVSYASCVKAHPQLPAKSSLTLSKTKSESVRNVTIKTGIKGGNSKPEQGNGVLISGRSKTYGDCFRDKESYRPKVQNYLTENLS